MPIITCNVPRSIDPYCIWLRYRDASRFPWHGHRMMRPVDCYERIILLKPFSFNVVWPLYWKKFQQIHVHLTVYKSKKLHVYWAICNLFLILIYRLLSGVVLATVAFFFLIVVNFFTARNVRNFIGSDARSMSITNWRRCQNVIFLKYYFYTHF